MSLVIRQIIGDGLILIVLGIATAFMHRNAAEA